MKVTIYDLGVSYPLDFFNMEDFKKFVAKNRIKNYSIEKGE